MSPYSQDVRHRVLQAIDAGHSQAEVEKRVERVRCTYQTVSQTSAREGQVHPKAIPGRPAVKGAALQAHLQAQLETHPDVTREEYCRLFSEAYGIQVSTASISRARMALGRTRKKDDPSQRAERGSSRDAAITSQAVAYPGSGHRG